MVNLTAKFMSVNAIKYWEPLITDEPICVIMDCNDMRWSNIPWDLRGLYMLLQMYHLLPDFVGQILIHDAPSIVMWFWSVARAIIPLGVMKKIRFTTNETITDFIDEEQLPFFIHTEAFLLRRGSYQPIIPANCMSNDEALEFHGIDLQWFRDKILHRARERIRQEIETYPFLYKDFKTPLLDNDRQ